MKALRRRTRETLRHERACVYQQQAADLDASGQAAFWAANRARAAELRRGVEGGGGHDEEAVGVVTGAPVAGSNDAAGDGRTKPCSYCGYVGGHSADCPVIS